MASFLFFIALLVSALLTLPQVQATYQLTSDFTGPNFFSGFSFFTGPDPTNGFVDFVDLATANASSLAGFLSVNGSNATTSPVYLGVDSSNVTSNGRPALRVSTNQTYNHALVVADIAHMPAGCGTWPAFWMLGTSHPWPAAGEIDIVEGVNTQAFNRMTLHTSSGVALANTSTPATGNASFTGQLVTADCDVTDPTQPTNAGCQIADQPSTPSFGAPFNLLGGGVVAMEWTSAAIAIWSFPRTSPLLPAVLSATNPDPSSWGEPNALFLPVVPGSIDSHFCALQLVFDTTFCGDWAGAVWSSTPECAALAPTCEAYVAGSPAAFADAFWAVNSLRVFQDDQDPFRVNGGDGRNPDGVGEASGNHTVSLRARGRKWRPRGRGPVAGWW